MSDTESKWKRTKPSRIYDYNYKVAEGYYKPQTEYIDNRFLRRAEQPPDDTHLSYAERFATRPWYGGTRGLPYDDRKAELNKPLLKPSERPRGSSLVREMKEDEKDGIPLHIRAMRRKKKMEEEEEKLGIRSPLDTKFPSRDFSRWNLPKPKNTRPSALDEEIKKLDVEISRHRDRNRRSASLTSEVATNYLKSPVRRHHEESYALPSGGRATKVTDTESYHSSSSYTRPPAAPRSRNLSFTDESSSVTRRPRSRLNSLTNDVPSAITRSYRHSSVTSDEDDTPSYSHRAAKIREERKHRESQALTENIHKMVDKMRVRDIDPQAVYTFRQSLRASSLEKDPLSRQRNKSRINNFVYGVGRY